MKYKLTIVIIATLILIGGSIGETLYIKHTFNDLKQQLIEQMNLSEYDVEDVTETFEWWKKKAEVLEVFVSVLQLNEITVTLGELKGYVEKQDFESARALYNRIYMYAECVSDMYMVKFNNIL